MKRIRAAFIVLLSAATAALVAASFTFSWLSGAVTDVEMDGLHGGIISQYFHCGSGTEQDPYVITKPVHLYNLTMLYENLDGFAEQDNHFQLGYNLDGNDGLEFYSYNDEGIYQNGYSTRLNMGYYDAFVPIGSAEKPFSGVFDGSGLILDNLNVSGSGVSDIGVFGFVTDEAEIKNLYIDNLTIDVSGAVTNAHAAHSHACVGYIAGHIENASCVTETYVNNCEITGNSVLTKNDWGYFGKCENAASIEMFINKASSGQGNDWGGSVDFKAFNQRIHDIFNTKTITYDTIKRYFAYYQNNEMKLSFGRNYTNIPDYLSRDPNISQTFYQLQGDGIHYITATSSTSIDLPGTVMPLLVNDDFSTASNNTGYLIGDTRMTSSRMVSDSSVRSSSYRICHIGNSLSDADISEGEAYNGTGDGASVTFNNSNTEIITNSSPTYSLSNYVLIKDANNSGHTVRNPNLTSYTKNDSTTPENLGLKKYNEAREDLTEVLKDATLVHGIHFMDKDLAYDNTTSLNTVKLNGATKSNYAFPKSCIDFHLKENGAINFFGGAYYNSDSDYISHADCFFSLSVIERDGDNLTRNSIKKISYIYNNTAYDKTNPDSQKYIYRYSDNSYSGSQSNVGDLVFDMRYLSETPPVQNAIYYFEIPVNKGEYALHGVSGHDAGGYLMYLDIGASGAGTGEGLVDDFKSVEYRSTPDTASNSILLITYSQGATNNLEIAVIYDDTRKRYDVICTGDAIEVTVTILSTEYAVYFNSLALPNEIGSYPNTPAT